MIADNRIAELSEFDDQLLGMHLRDLSKFGLSIDLEATGFEIGEIDVRIQALDAGGTYDAADQIRAIMPGTPISKTGDVWQLGPHRIMCGDALVKDNYSRLFAGKLAAVVFTDPAYNLTICGHVSGNGAIQHREFFEASGEKTAVAYTEFLTRGLRLVTQSSASGAIIFVCMDWRHGQELLTAAHANNLNHLNICVWVKHNAGMGSLYRSQHEFVHVFKNGKGRHRNNVQLGRFGRARSNVWNYRGANSFGGTTDEGNLLALHPTPKPVAMLADAILDCSARGDIVLDCFLGVGSTLIAAERTGRI